MTETAVCSFCGAPLQESFALACGRGGQSTRIPLGFGPCMTPECVDRRRAEQARRDEEAVARAIENGVIDP